MKAIFLMKVICGACLLIDVQLDQVEYMYQSHVEVEDHESQVGSGVWEVETLSRAADGGRNHGGLLYRFCPGPGLLDRPSPFV